MFGKILKKLHISEDRLEDVIVRSVKTFLQVFIYYFPFDAIVASGSAWQSAVRAGITGAGSMAVCAVWNYIKEVLTSSSDGGGING